MLRAHRRLLLINPSCALTLRREGELQAGGTCQPGVGTRAASGTAGCAPGRPPRTRSPAHALDVNEAFAVPTCQLGRFMGAGLGLKRGPDGSPAPASCPLGRRLDHPHLRSSPSSLLLVTLFPFNSPAPAHLPLSSSSASARGSHRPRLLRFPLGEGGTHGRCACPFCLPPNSRPWESGHVCSSPPGMATLPEQRSLSRPRSHGPRTGLCLHFHP